jgi:hypothetical protein
MFLPTVDLPVRNSIQGEPFMRIASDVFRPFSVRLGAGLLSVAALSVPLAQAQNLGYEGPTGIFVTPLASTAASPAKGLGRPVIAAHVLAGGPVIGTFSTYSVTEGFAKIAEFGYTREEHAAGDTAGLSPLWKGGFNILHGKLNVVPENAGKTKWVPGISVGTIVRVSDEHVFDGTNGQTKNNADFYFVATKVVTQTKKVPLVLNFGVRATNASLWGLGGNAPDFEARAFGALAFVFTGPGKSTIILGSEAAQQPKRILSTDASGIQSSVLDIPTSIDYAIRVVPSAKHKLNIDAGILQAGGRIGTGVDLKARARFAFGISYGF